MTFLLTKSLSFDIIRLINQPNGDQTMAHEQIEYCGNCEHYAKCVELAKEGRLYKCKANKKSKQVR